MTNSVNIKGPERDEIISAWNGQVNVRVRIAGNGPALVYFHPASGLYWDEFLDNLAEEYTVYAPELPGTTPGDPYAIHRVNNYNDLLLIYEEIIRTLGLQGATAIGLSMGGMIACDLATYYPSVFSRLVALAPAGLWRDDAPPAVADVYVAPPEKLPGFLFKDPSLPAAQAMLALPENPADIPAHVAQAVWALGCAGKFMWPFPEHGLRDRLHRISIPTLVLWGNDDKLIPAAYAEDFGKEINNCDVRLYEDCGHLLQMEKLEKTIADVKAFLA